MRYKKIISLLLVMICVFSFVNQAQGAEIPYKAYTYDYWWQPVESPSGYEPRQLFTGESLGVGPMKEPSDIAVSKDGKEIYILDTGNNRLIVTDKEFKNTRIIDKFTYKGAVSELNQPKGVYIDSEGMIYIADSGNKRVIVSKQNGDIQSVFTKPSSSLFPQGNEFIPNKVVVDKTGSVYIICEGVYNGAVIYSREGQFMGYFGSNRVERNMRLLMDKFWKKLLSKEQKQNLPKYIPVEYTNFDIDKENFIYTCTDNSNYVDNIVRKINPMGVNILLQRVHHSFPGGFGDLIPYFYNNQMISTKLIDIDVDDDGFITCFDFTRGRIFQYDQDANLMFAFGGLGLQLGMFRTPTALTHIEDKLLVLDKGMNAVTLFGLTEFGAKVHEAMKLYNDGRYDEAVAPWKEVIKLDANYNLAYIGIGKAMLESGNNIEAMKYFKTGYYPKGYDAAYSEYRSDWLRAHFSLIFFPIVMLIFLIYTRNLAFSKKLRKKLKNKFFMWFPSRLSRNSKGEI